MNKKPQPCPMQLKKEVRTRAKIRRHRGLKPGPIARLYCLKKSFYFVCYIHSPTLPTKRTLYHCLQPSTLYKNADCSSAASIVLFCQVAASFK